MSTATDAASLAQIASTACAAIAAGAAWRAVTLQGRSQRAAHLPNVSASFIVIRHPVPQAHIEFVNAGPGLSIYLGYFGISDGQGFAGTAGKGHLLPAERTEVLLPIQPPDPTTADRATFIWCSRDIYNNNLHMWSYDGRYATAKGEPGSKDWPRLDDVFGTMYPAVQIPEAVIRAIRGDGET